MSRFALITNLLAIAAVVGLAILAYMVLGQISETFANLF